MKIKIIANPKKSWAVELAGALAPILTGAGHKVVKRGADATICIGGDGTILYASHRKRIEGPILGIGGDKSYICQIHRNDWKEKLLPSLGGGREKIMALECAVGAKRFIALNDVVVHATHYRVAEMDVSIETEERKLEAQFEGDGMIISTPLGSAAYAYSAGGEKLKPKERKISLVPICPYKRAFLPKVLPENSRITIKAGSDCAFITDGIFVRNLKKGESVFVKKGPDMIFFGGVGNE
jgi:NAD+ kinase